jgi:hypothetical protein
MEGALRGVVDDVLERNIDVFSTELHREGLVRLVAQTIKK